MYNDINNIATTSYHIFFLNHEGKKMSHPTHSHTGFCPVILTCHVMWVQQEHLLRDKWWGVQNLPIDTLTAVLTASLESDDK